jgi:hypothetical protein
MLLLIIIGFFLIAGVILWLNTTKIRPGFIWVFVLGVTIIAWAFTWGVIGENPETLAVLNWEALPYLPYSPTLLIDNISWGFGLAILSLLCAVMLTDVIQSAGIDPQTWAIGLAITASGLLAVFAGDPISLLLSWAIIDVAETTMLLLMVGGSDQRERVVISFSVRVVGMLFVITAIVQSASLGTPFDFDHILPEISGYLLLAAGLRLGVLPPHQPFLQEPPLRRGMGTLTRLIPVAASLVLVARVAPIGPPQKWEIPILVVSVVAILSSAFNWIRAQNELDGRPYWILSGAGFAIVAAVRQQPDASLAWGLGTIFSGGVLFLLGIKARPLVIITLIGGVFFSALPYSPIWQGISIYSEKNIFLSGTLFFAHALLLLGYLRHTLKIHSVENESVRWAGFIAPIGLMFLPVTHFGVTWTLWGSLLPDSGVYLLPWWGGGLVLGLVGFLIFLSRKTLTVSENFFTSIRTFFSFGWVYRSLWWFYRAVGKTIYNFTQILEGEGGVLWSILFLILFVAALAQLDGGG